MSTGAFGASGFGGEPFGSDPDKPVVPEVPVETPTQVPVKSSVVLTATAKPTTERFIRINPPTAAPAIYAITRKRPGT